MKRYAMVAITCILLARPSAAQTGGGSSASGDAETLEAAAETISRMKTAMKIVLDKLEEARSSKDVVKLNCVNEKLTQIRGLLKTSEQADIALREAISNRDPDAEAEFAKIAISRTKIEKLRAEAEQCSGQVAYMVDERTNVEVEQPANLPAAGADATSLGILSRGTLVAQVAAESMMAGSDTVVGAGPPVGATGPATQQSLDLPKGPIVQRPADASPWR